MSSTEFLLFSLLPIAGYLLGSVPTSVWVTRRVKGIDVRDAGSGHATTTNTIRQAGWPAGLLVFVVDVAKGFLPTFVALQLSPSPWLAAITALGAVSGHCWPIWAGFRGGMGLATAGGAFFAVSPLGFLIGFGVLVALVLVIHHSARASMLTGVTLPLIYWAAGFKPMLIWVSAAVGFVLAIRFASDWRRKYRELWLDRDKNSN